MVNARERALNHMLDGHWQYEVPLYQRPFQWGEANRSQLWKDVVALVEERDRDPRGSHFLGSLVMAPAPGTFAGGVQRFLVVDGQQRLTTLTLLLAALRDRLEEAGLSERANELHERYLINAREDDDLRLKLVPTETDRGAYRSVVEKIPGNGTSRGIRETYEYFRSQLSKLDDGSLEAVATAVTHGLSLVVITTEWKDNVHRIFESLNNTGLQLSQADLVRNYLFMRLPTQAEDVYRRYWKPLQDSLTTEELEILFWFDLARRRPTVVQTDTYSEQQKRLESLEGEDAIAGEVARFAAMGRLLRVVTHPEEEHDPEVRKRLRRLREWDSSAVLPALLHFLDLRASGRAESQEIGRAMLTIESYLVRRLVTGHSSSNVNRTVLGLVAEADTDLPIDEATVEYLSTGRKHFATDERVRQEAVLSPFYTRGRAGHRALVLRWIEESFDSMEPVDLDRTTIEHVMPQTLSDRWRDDLDRWAGPSESIDEVHARLVHTLGNLTLTGYNSPLSNRPFAEKRVELARSGIRLSESVAVESEWGPEQITERGRSLAERIIATWPGPVEMPTMDVSQLWRRMTELTDAIPEGWWTSYGDLANAIGTHAVPLAQRLATTPVTNGHRVLTHNGSVSPGFRWVDKNDDRDVHEVLRAEGLRFDPSGRADPQRRIDLATVARRTPEGDLEKPTWASDDGTLRRRLVSEFRQHSRRSLFHDEVVTTSELAGWVIDGRPLGNGRRAEWAPGRGGRQNDDLVGRYAALPGAAEARNLLRSYAGRFLPFPERTEGRYWRVSLSSRPGGLWVLLIGGLRTLECLHNGDDLSYRLYIARSPLLADVRTARDDGVGDSVEVLDSDLDSGGDDQVMLRIHGDRAMEAILGDPPFQRAIRLHNARLSMWKSPFMETHVPALLDGAW